MRFLLLVLLLCFNSTAHADAAAMEACSAIVNKLDRLQCYDAAVLLKPAPRSYMTQAWDLDGHGNPVEDGIRRLEPYRKNYALVNYTSHINHSPSSPAPNHTVLTPYPYEKVEMKFQFSAKSEIGNYRNLEFLGFHNFRIWGAFTQQSYWQAFNVHQSSPFRESNYEPELIGTLGTNATQGWKLLNFALSHQSNGRSGAESRSWNRFYLQGGWEWQDVCVLGRGWWRIPETTLQDDNPDITHYVGRAEVLAHWSPAEDDEVILLLRSNLEPRNHKGYIQINWASPFTVGRSSQINLQLSSGYGDNLLDYNYHQTSFGMGIVFKEW